MISRSSARQFVVKTQPRGGTKTTAAAAARAVKAGPAVAEEANAARDIRANQIGRTFGMSI